MAVLIGLAGPVVGAVPALAATWTPTEPLTPAPAAQLQVATIAPGGRALVVVAADGRPALFERETDGALFTEVPAPAGVTRLSDPEAVVGADGSALLVWNAAAENAAPRHMFSVRPAGGTWTAPKRLRLLDGGGAPGPPGPGHRLAIDDQGRPEILTGVYTADGHVAVRLLRRIQGRWRNQGARVVLGRPRTSGDAVIPDLALDLDGRGAAAAAAPVAGGWVIATWSDASGWRVQTVEAPPSWSTDVAVDGDDVALTGASCVSPQQRSVGERTPGDVFLAVRSGGVWRQATVPSTGYAPCTGVPALFRGGLLVGWTSLRTSVADGPEEIFAVRWNAGEAPVARSLAPTTDDLRVRAPIAVAAGGDGLMMWWQWQGTTPAPTLQGAAGLFGDAPSAEDIPGQTGTLMTAADVADDGAGIVVEQRPDGTLAILSRAPGAYGY